MSHVPVVTPAEEDLLRQHFSRIRVAGSRDKVYKDECAFSFHTPESPGGLNICLNTFVGFSPEFSEREFLRSGRAVYLNIQRFKVPKSAPAVDDDEGSGAQEPPKKKPTVVAIGIDGGFETSENFTFEEHNALVVYPGPTVISLPKRDLPHLVATAVDGILLASSEQRKEEVAAWVPDSLKESKFSLGLVQLDNGVQIPPTGWKCAQCEKTENLWLNLTDGAIGCGRKTFDGSGGNNHASEHYQKTRFPLAVKLGTITADSADVFSYPEDDMVLDSLLPHHLRHFGIDMAAMKKSDKSMAELTLDQNMNFDFSRIEERGKELQLLYGPGYTGLQNLGNSCFMASVMQSVLSIPEFQKRYFAESERIFSKDGSQAASDVELQMAKLACGLLSGNYSRPPDSAEKKDQEGIRPRTFKGLFKDHPEFKTMMQNDAWDFFQYLLTIVSRNERITSPGADVTDIFRFDIEEKTRCTVSKRVHCSLERGHTALSLVIPVDLATNKAEVDAFESKRAAQEALGLKVPPEDFVRPVISLNACLQSFAAEALIPDFYSSAAKAHVLGIKSTRLKNMPRVLLLVLRRYYVTPQGQPAKLDCLIDVPQELDIEWMRSSALAADELPLEDEPAQPAAAAPQADEGIVAELSSMGFPIERCRKAALATKNSSSAEAAEWIFAHMDDPDIDEPVAVSSAAASGGAASDPESVAMLCSMGFSQSQADKALRATGGDLERATDWIFSHADDMETSDAPPAGAAATAAAAPNDDGVGKYTMFAIISHLGRSTASGHYVAHIKKDGRWVIFNDAKVAQSAEPPFDLGYMYLFRRNDA